MYLKHELKIDKHQGESSLFEWNSIPKNKTTALESKRFSLSTGETEKDSHCQHWWVRV